LKLKRLSRKEIFERCLTVVGAAVECAALVGTKVSTGMLFNNLNQAIRVGACGVRLVIARLSASQVTLVNLRVFCDC
jgi:hypothetical protein